MNEIRNIVSDIKSGNIKPIYFLMGDEPYYIDKISDYIVAMQLELEQAKKEQTRFDQEIREKALLDPKTRIGNRDFFTSHLEAILREEGIKIR